jgi:nitrate reductase NapD
LSELHISSLVVHGRVEQAATIHAAIEAVPGAEIHAHQSGKTIVTLETATEAEVVERMNAISRLDGVFSALLVFHHVEPVPADGEEA